MEGLEAALQHGADIIVNTDADNQYQAKDIPKLIEPILSGEAEIVIGARPIMEMKEFSPVKRLLQKFGSFVVRLASRTRVEDAPSGFRALSRQAAGRMNVFNEHTYTLETIIQAGQKGMAVVNVPVRTNRPRRPSRLVKSTPHYIRRSLVTILRIFVTYQPFRFFAVPGTLMFTAGLLLGFRFTWFYFTGGGGGHVQSLILSALLLGSGLLLLLIGLVADLISVNRKLLEKLDSRIRHLDDQLREDRIYH